MGEFRAPISDGGDDRPLFRSGALGEGLGKVLWDDPYVLRKEVNGI